MVSRPGSGFQPFAEVVESALLWGRNEPGGLLEGMVKAIGMGTNFHLYGERRSGKSSLLHCSESRVAQEFDDLLPVYLNFRVHNSIIGAANVHRFIVAQILGRIHEKGLQYFTNEQLRIRLSDDWESIYARLLVDVADYAVPTLLERCVATVEQGGLGVVLLIDEYEHLMIHSYGGEAGAFFVLRNLSARSYAAGRPKPLTFVMAGAELWQDICDVVGSPELNTAISSFDVGPIAFRPFAEMWQHCVSGSDDLSQKLLQSRRWSDLDVLDMAGGWPFFGKVIGHQLLSMDLAESDIDDLLRPYFDVMWRRLGRSRSTLVAAENGHAEATPTVRALSRRGLLKEGVDGGFGPCGTAWARYIREHAADVNEGELGSGMLVRLRVELLAELANVRRIVFADDMLRESLAGDFTTLTTWAKNSIDSAEIKTVTRALAESAGREAIVISELSARVNAAHEGAERGYEPS